MTKITIPPFRDPFAFKAAKDPFHRGIIQAVPSAAHALYYAIVPEQLSVFVAFILNALI